MRLTRAVTPIRLGDAHHAKSAALDALAAAYRQLCQQSAAPMPATQRLAVVQPPAQSAAWETGVGEGVRRGEKG